MSFTPLLFLVVGLLLCWLALSVVIAAVLGRVITRAEGERLPLVGVTHSGGVRGETTPEWVTIR